MLYYEMSIIKNYMKNINIINYEMSIKHGIYTYTHIFMNTMTYKMYIKNINIINVYYIMDIILLTNVYI